jgi:hypothetical protein
VQAALAGGIGNNVNFFQRAPPFFSHELSRFTTERGEKKIANVEQRLCALNSIDGVLPGLFPAPLWFALIIRAPSTFFPIP